MKDHRPTLKKMEKIKDGRFIKNYMLTYVNQNGKEKKYEMISFNNMEKPEELGSVNRGVAIIAMYKGKLLLLREFRMPVNDYVYNLVAGTIEPGETVEDCVRREIFEETGLDVCHIVKVLPPAFAAAAMTDLKTTFVLAEVTGTLSSEYTNEHEEIHGRFYTPEEVRDLLESTRFAANCQLVAWFYSALAVFTDAFKQLESQKES